MDLKKLIEDLRALDDGNARPVTIMERGACGRAAHVIEHLVDAIHFAHSEGFAWPRDPLDVPEKQAA